MTLIGFWFLAVTVLWVVFLVLEGFDFGVGMLHGIVGRDEAGRRTTINTIGPLWDGNEVWLIVAAAAIFAAYPGWYATMFSALYLALVLLLGALIVRGVSFEFRGKGETDRWRRTWDGLMTGGSFLAPFLIGVALGDLLYGLPIDENQEFTGNFWDLFSAYSIFVGVTFVLICLLHGATFLALKTTGEVRERALAAARRVAPATVVAVFAFALWTRAVADRGAIPNLAEVTAILAVLAAAWLTYDGREGWAFAATTVTMGTCVASIFVDLYPRVMVSSIAAANDLTAQNTAAGPYSLKVVTVVVAVLLPVVLCYQAWSYHVFRQRIRPTDVAARSSEPTPPPTGAHAPDVTAGRQ